MTSLREHVDFLSGHWLGAMAASIAFVLGAASAPFALRSGVKALTALPLWMLRRIAAAMSRRPPMWRLAVFIFAFNGAAMFVYLLLGLIPFMPAVMAFWAGMNVAVVMLKSGEEPMPAGPPQDSVTIGEGGGTGVGQALAAVCTVLTLCLELPCFWFTIGMAQGMDYWAGTALEPEHLADLRMRMMTYVRVVLPLLGVSALAEAYAVRWPMGRG